MLRGITSIVAVAGLLILSGCASGSTAERPTTSSSAPASTSSQPPSSPTSDAIERTVVNVAVKDGKVSPKTHRVKVAKGTQVRLMVTSDVDDEVHVHGYEIEKEVLAGQTVTIDFTADQTGVFEVESHESNLQLIQLEVK
jgi:heme/copper-type cytochrome/quinol oxidase subunit 2